MDRYQPNALYPSPPPPGFLRQARWNPYVGGAGIGLLSWVVFALVDKPLYRQLPYFDSSLDDFATIEEDPKG